jgi:hypothetical protein
MSSTRTSAVSPHYLRRIADQRLTLLTLPQLTMTGFSREMTPGSYSSSEAVIPQRTATD